MSNQEIPHNATVRIISEYLIKVYNARLADHHNMSSDIDSTNSEEDISNKTKFAVFMAIGTFESAHECAFDIFGLVNINISITIENIVKLTKLSSKDVMLALSSLISEGFIIANETNPKTFSLSLETKEQLKS